MNQSEPSEVPLYSNMWVGREPQTRELSEEFANLYRLVVELKLKVEELEAELEG